MADFAKLWSMKSKSAAVSAKPRATVKPLYKVEVEPASLGAASGNGKPASGKKPRYQVLKPALVPTHISREELEAAVQAVTRRAA